MTTSKKRAKRQPKAVEPTLPPIPNPYLPGAGPPPWLDTEMLATMEHRPGRTPGKWSEPAMALVITAITQTGSIDVAAGVAGVSRSTLELWLERGREDQRLWEVAPLEGRQRGEPTEWHQFARAITWAVGTWAGRHLAKLEHVCDADSTPLALQVSTRQWLLTKHGPRMAERVEHTHTITTETQEVADQMRERLAQIRERHQAVKKA